MAIPADPQAGCAARVSTPPGPVAGLIAASQGRKRSLEQLAASAGSALADQRLIDPPVS
jgi:hypothetical protein